MRTLTQTLLVFALLTTLSACSLLDVKIENPAEPLTDQQMNMRKLTRDFLPIYSETIEQVADEIVEGTDDIDVKVSVLYWKLSSDQAAVSAALQSDPMIVIIDMWLLIAEQKLYFSSDAANEFFKGTEQDITPAVTELLTQFKALSKAILTEKEYSKASGFIDQQLSQDEPENMSFKRGSIIAQWYQYQGLSLADANSNVGTLPQVMSDISDRVDLSTAQASKSIAWKLEMLNLRSGLKDGQLSQLLGSIQKTAAQLADLTEDNPERVKRIAETFGEEFSPIMAEFTAELTEERLALAELLTEQRQALGVMVSEERAQILTDAEAISDRLIRTTIEELKSLIVIVVAALLLLILVLFFVPFYIGYLLGKNKGKKNRA
ncbi:hypothetical protein EDC56_0965 [Sinobacterium caligoides]|uniref:Chemotaxis protein n=1 Tax=Sinobacterium caligoides TaxID=933926 RepID=A0A3N2E1I9_9GAMM|nr:hypothetical protein [Sinobacterium caligoides]ROS05435.1 hypothetical protein EDC56_0965 [Sinobacterium caligoides]